MVIDLYELDLRGSVDCDIRGNSAEEFVVRRYLDSLNDYRNEYIIRLSLEDGMNIYKCVHTNYHCSPEIYSEVELYEDMSHIVDVCSDLLINHRQPYVGLMLYRSVLTLYSTLNKKEVISSREAVIVLNAISRLLPESLLSVNSVIECHDIGEYSYVDFEPIESKLCKGLHKGDTADLIIFIGALSKYRFSLVERYASMFDLVSSEFDNDCFKYLCELEVHNMRVNA